MTALHRFVLLASLALCAACASARAQPSRWVREELYFGRSIAPGRGCTADSVSENDWRGFVDSIVTPRFPDGFTVLDAAGQYGVDGVVIRERTKLLVVVHPRGDEPERKIDAVIAEYVRRFCQTSVGRVSATVHAVF